MVLIYDLNDKDFLYLVVCQQKKIKSRVIWPIIMGKVSHPWADQ